MLRAVRGVQNQLNYPGATDSDNESIGDRQGKYYPIVTRGYLARFVLEVFFIGPGEGYKDYANHTGHNGIHFAPWTYSGQWTDGDCKDRNQQRGRINFRFMLGLTPDISQAPAQ